MGVEAIIEPSAGCPDWFESLLISPPTPHTADLHMTGHEIRGVPPRGAALPGSVVRSYLAGLVLTALLTSRSIVMARRGGATSESSYSFSTRRTSCISLIVPCMAAREGRE